MRILLCLERESSENIGNHVRERRDSWKKSKRSNPLFLGGFRRHKKKTEEIRNEEISLEREKFWARNGSSRKIRGNNTTAMPISGGTRMLRARRKDCNVKPNRRLDRKSSRGMLFENEELRMRTITINAEVEQGIQVLVSTEFSALSQRASGFVK